MATTPYFVLSPNTVLSLLGLIHGPDRTEPDPIGDWRLAKVDLVIPALNEERDIVLCLASVKRQTMQPRRIFLIDDGSRDETLERAREYCELNGLDLVAVRRHSPIGKTPTIKRQARELDSDVEFILDGDTVLDSPNYIERTVQELYKGVGIASACGMIMPLRARDRGALIVESSVQRFLAARPDVELEDDASLLRRISQGITNLYRGVLYLFLQGFVYHGQMVFFGTIANPVGCAVAYRRQYIEDLFDHYEPILGDDLTNSEDIFIGFALANEGYRNIQLHDVFARSREPLAQRLPAQVYLWSSSFLQSCYYFDGLLRSPFKTLKRWRHKRKIKRLGIAEKRQRREAYRQAFGRDHTREYGRPVGWVVLLGALEKVGFPTALVIMASLKMWEPLAMTFLVETVLSLTVLTVVAKGRRLEYLGKGILVTPMRYATVLFDLITMTVFAIDLWVLREREWRK